MGCLRLNDMKIWTFKSLLSTLILTCNFLQQNARRRLSPKLCRAQTREPIRVRNWFQTICSPANDKLDQLTVFLRGSVPSRRKSPLTNVTSIRTLDAYQAEWSRAAQIRRLNLEVMHILDRLHNLGKSKAVQQFWLPYLCERLGVHFGTTPFTPRERVREHNLFRPPSESLVCCAVLRISMTIQMVVWQTVK